MSGGDETRRDLRASSRRQFGSAAPRYAESPVHVAGPDLDALVAAAKLTGGERVLDVGCGAGHTALAFAPLAAEVVALDLSPAMLVVARGLARERGLGNLSFRAGDAADLPFPDAHFDVVAARIGALLDAAPQEVRTAFEVAGRGDYSFSMPIALVLGRKP